MSFQISQPPLLLPPRARGAGASAWYEPAPFAREREKSVSACRFPFPRLFFFFFFSSRRHPLKTASLVFLFENSIFCGLVENLLAPCSLCKQFR